MELPKPPEDQELRNIIDKLAQFVARNGPEFEQMTKNKQKDNPKFGFLFGGEYFNYYQYKVTTEQAILKQKQKTLEHQQQQQAIVQHVITQQSIKSAPWQTHVQQQQIQQSEQNLAAQHHVLMQQQQVQVDEVIRKAQDEKLQAIAKDSDIDLQDMDRVMQPIIDSCTKDAISAGKGWIFTHSNDSKSNEVIARYLLKRVTTIGTSFELKLHLIYLINDVLHHCVRKGAEELKKALGNVVVPIFCTTSLGASEDQKQKLAKLLKLWESNNYFIPTTLEQLKSPSASLAAYQASLITEHAVVVTPIITTIQNQYAALQKQHQEYVAHVTSQLQSSVPGALGQISPFSTLAAQQPVGVQPVVSTDGTIPVNQSMGINNVGNSIGQPAAAVVAMTPSSGGSNSSGPPPELVQGLSPGVLPPQNQTVVQPLQQQQQQQQPRPPLGPGPPIPYGQPPPGFVPNFGPPPNFNQPPPGYPQNFPQPLPSFSQPLTALPPPPFVQGMPLPDLSRPPPGYAPLGPPAVQIPPPDQSDLMPAVPYYELPAGLMVPLVKLEDCDYKPLDPNDIRLPPPAPPSERLLAAVELFYAPATHERPRNSSEGWEQLGLYEFFKAKHHAKKTKEEDIREGRRPASPRERSRSKSRERQYRSRSRSPPRRRYREIINQSKTPTKPRSRSRSKSRSSSRSRSRSRSRSPLPFPRAARSRSHSGSGSRSRSPSPIQTKRRSSSRSPTPPSFFGGAYPTTHLDKRLDESNKGHQLLKKMGWSGSGGLGATEQGIQDPISGGEVRDRQDQYKGIGINLNDPFESFRKSKGQAFINRMKARAEEKIN